MIFHRQNDILMERFDDHLLLFDLKKNLPYVLNGVAAFIFMHTNGVVSQEDIAKMVCREYNVSFSQALSDIKGIYEEFSRKRMVRREG